MQIGNTRTLKKLLSKFLSCMCLQLLLTYFTDSSIMLTHSMVNANRAKQKTVGSLHSNAADFLVSGMGSMNGETVYQPCPKIRIQIYIRE